MNKLLWVPILFFCSVGAPVALAQGVQVSRDNRTIAVTITETVEAEPEIAVVHIGYNNFGPSREAAYEQNGQVSQKIIDALQVAGVKKESIETSEVRLEHVDTEDKQWTDEQKKERQFEASQTWNVRVLPAEAQNLVDHAVAAGANRLEGVNWIVADLAVLDAKASDAALVKARALAEKMAREFGGKAGELLFVSNTQPSNVYPGLFNAGFGMANNMQIVTVTAAPKPTLKLFPEKVRRDATVYVVFALE